MEQPKTIAAVLGAESPKVQQIFRDLAARWSSQARIVGVIEEGQRLGGGTCRAGLLRSVASGDLYPIFQDLGPGSTACDLDGDGALSACEAVRRDIQQGCDLVILSKFGMLEAEHEGLADAFVAALEAEAPILTCVSQRFEATWTQFAESLFVSLPGEAEAIEAWWRSVWESQGRATPQRAASLAEAPRP